MKYGSVLGLPSVLRFAPKEKEFVSELLALGIPASAIWSEVSISKTAVEKITASAWPTDSKKERAERVKFLLDKFGVVTFSQRFEARKVKAT